MVPDQTKSIVSTHYLWGCWQWWTCGEAAWPPVWFSTRAECCCQTSSRPAGSRTWWCRGYCWA